MFRTRFEDEASRDSNFTWLAIPDVIFSYDTSSIANASHKCLPGFCVQGRARHKRASKCSAAGHSPPYKTHQANFNAYRVEMLAIRQQFGPSPRCCVIRKVLILPGKLVVDQLIEAWKYYSGVTGGATDTPATATAADDENRWHSQIPSHYFYFQEQVMTKFISAIKKFANDEQGITAIEYCLLAAVLSTVVLGAFPTLEASLKAFFTALGTKLNNSLSDA